MSGSTFRTASKVTANIARGGLFNVVAAIAERFVQVSFWVSVMRKK